MHANLYVFLASGLTYELYPKKQGASPLVCWRNERTPGCGRIHGSTKNGEPRISLDIDANRLILLDRVPTNEPETEQTLF
ncbi:MAG: hypothetical protein ACOCX5_01740 [Chloroflexota bacterium]